MIQYYYKTVRDDEFQLIPQVKEGCWIHVEDATTEDLAMLSQLLGLEQTDLQDCLEFRGRRKTVWMPPQLEGLFWCDGRCGTAVNAKKGDRLPLRLRWSAGRF